MFDRNGLEKKLRASPRNLFSRKILGAALVSPCDGRNFGGNLRRRVMGKILVKICAAFCWPESAPCAGQNLRRRRNLRKMYSETGLNVLFVLFPLFSAFLFFAGELVFPR